MQIDDFIRLCDGLEGLAEIDLHLYGRLCARIPPSEDELAIPGEVSVLQSRMLTHLLARQWRAAGNVLEIGTLLGVSTQAIGLGMAANLRRAGRYVLLMRSGDIGLKA
jgi:predicted O-methyltransferase YrrM